jgi:hypothetical protein
MYIKYTFVSGNNLPGLLVVKVLGAVALPVTITSTFSIHQKYAFNPPSVPHLYHIVQLVVTKKRIPLRVQLQQTKERSFPDGKYWRILQDADMVGGAAVSMYQQVIPA